MQLQLVDGEPKPIQFFTSLYIHGHEKTRRIISTSLALKRNNKNMYILLNCILSS